MDITQSTAETCVPLHLSVCAQVVLKALSVMLPSMFSVLLVILVIWLVFSMMGVSLFAGRFSYCYNETSEEVFSVEQVNNKTECFLLLEQNFSEVFWKNNKFNFDNVGMGFLSLLIMVSVKTPRINSKLRQNMETTQIMELI